MRSKWIRYSSSSASRSPCWAWSTRARTRAVSLSFFWVVGASDITDTYGVPRGPVCLTQPRSGCGAEADPALAPVALDVPHTPDEDRVAAVLGLEGERRVVVAGERNVEIVGRLQRDEDRENLLAVEGDFDADTFGVRHCRRTLPELHRSTRGGRTRPGARRGHGAAARRSAGRP